VATATAVRGPNDSQPPFDLETFIIREETGAPLPVREKSASCGPLFVGSRHRTPPGSSTAGPTTTCTAWPDDCQPEGKRNNGAIDSLKELAARLKAIAREVQALALDTRSTDDIDSPEWHEAWEQSWVNYIRDLRNSSSAL